MDLLGVSRWSEANKKTFRVLTVKIYFLIISAFLLFSPFSNANNLPLENVPPLHQLVVFQSETEPNHYLILGRDGIYQDTSTWYVLDWKNGQITSPVLKRNSTFAHGGPGFDFKFESGEWLYVGAGNYDKLNPGAHLEVMPYGLVHPNRGLEPLKKLTVNKALVEKLGLLKMVAEKELKQLAELEESRQQERKKIVTPNENLVLISYVYKYKNEPQRNAGRELSERLRQDDSVIYVKDPMGGENIYNSIWTTESQVPRIQKEIEEKVLLKPSIVKDYTQKDATEINIESDKFHDLHEEKQVALASKYIAELKEKIAPFTLEEKDKAALTLHNVIFYLEHARKTLTQIEHYLEYRETPAGVKAEFERNFDLPIQALMIQAYTLLDKMQTPLARKVLLFAGDDQTDRAAFMTKPSGVGNNTYFQHWLNILKEHIGWVHTLSEEDQKNKNGARIKDVNLEEFTLNVTGKDFRLQNHDPLFITSDQLKFSPLLVFGFIDNPAYRSEFIRFVIEMDKLAEKQRIQFKGRYDSKITGNAILLHVLKGITYTITYSDTKQISGFSEILYFKQALMITTELLNISRITITNSATYLAILNTAVSLQKRITRRFGLVPNATTNTPELNALTEQLLLLNQALQVRLVRNLFLDPTVEAFDGKNCDRILKPQ